MKSSAWNRRSKRSLPRAPSCGAPRRSEKKTGQGVDPGIDRVRLDQYPRDAVLDDFRNAAGATRHDRATVAHRLGQHAPESLPAGGKAHDVGRSQIGTGVRYRTGEGHTIGKVVSGDQVAQRRFPAAGADKDEPDALAAAHETGQGGDEHVRSLRGLERAGLDESFSSACGEAPRRGGGSRRVDRRREIGAVPYRGHAGGGEVQDAARVAGYRLRDAEEMIGETSQEPPVRAIDRVALRPPPRRSPTFRGSSSPTEVSDRVEMLRAARAAIPPRRSAFRQCVCTISTSSRRQ